MPDGPFVYPPLSPQFAVISVSGASQSIATPAAGKRIRVLAYTVICTAAGSVTFKSASTAITGAMVLGAGGGMSPAYNPGGHFETAVDEELVLADGTGTNVFGHLTYVEV